MIIQNGNKLMSLLSLMSFCPFPGCLQPLNFLFREKLIFAVKVIILGEECEKF